MPLDTPDYGQASAPGQLTLLTINGTGAVVGTQTKVVGAAVHALMFYSTANAVTWTLAGVQSGIIYLVFKGAAVGNIPIVVPWFSSLDTSVQLSNDGTAVANGSQTQLVAIYDTMAIAPFGSGTNPVSVGGLGSTGVINGYPLATMPGASLSGQIAAGMISALAGGTIVTVPANREWLGTVWVSGVGSGGGASNVDVQTSGVGVAPAAGTSVARITLPNSATPMALAVAGVYVFAGSGASGLIQLVASGAAAVAAGASGILL